MLFSLLFIIDLSAAPKKATRIELIGTASPPPMPTAVATPLEDAAYVCAVGSGSCNIVIQTMLNPADPTYIFRIALICDAGTKSARTHHKLLSESKGFHALFSNTPQHAAEAQSQPPAASSAVDESHPMFDEPSQARATSRSDSEFSTTAREGVSAPNHATKTRIQKILEAHQCNRIILLLSHPDEDHISYTTYIPNIINDSIVPMIAILAGDWLSKPLATGHEYTKTHGYQLGHTVTGQVLNHLLQRPNTELFLPFYHKYNRTDLHQRIRADLKTGTNQLAQQFGKEADQVVLLPEPFYNTLAVFMTYFQLIGENFAGTEGMFQNIYVWSLNNISSDANEQSMIVSYTHLSFDQTFIFTGDATDYQFKQIATIEGKEGRPTKDILRTFYKRDANHTVVFVVPHHGSSENISTTALNLFCPNVFVISAGNGGLYPHPELDVIKQINDWSQHNPSYVQTFLQKFRIKNHQTFAAFNLYTPNDDETDASAKTNVNQKKAVMRSYALSTNPLQLAMFLKNHERNIIGRKLMQAANTAKKAGLTLQATQNTRVEAQAALATAYNRIQTTLANTPHTRALFTPRQSEEQRAQQLTALKARLDMAVYEESLKITEARGTLKELQDLLREYKALDEHAAAQAWPVETFQAYQHRQLQALNATRVRILDHKRIVPRLLPKLYEKTNAPVILCTNGLGTLRFTAYEVANQFSNLIEAQNGKKYQISIDTHIAESGILPDTAITIQHSDLILNKKHKLANKVTGIFTKQSPNLFVNETNHNALLGVKIEEKDCIYWYYGTEIASPSVTVTTAATAAAE